MVIVTEFRQRRSNVLLFVGGRILLLPLSEVTVVGDRLQVEQEQIEAAFDLTPDLPHRVVGSAWKHEIVFPNEVDNAWAASVARAVPGLSALDIVRAFTSKMEEWR